MDIDLAAFIDHTVLKEGTQITDVDKVCLEAGQENFAAVCIPSRYVVEARKMLKGSGVKVATVVAFPMGEGSRDQKAAAIKAAAKAGADEVDMVADILAIKSGDWKRVEAEITACMKPVTTTGITLKVIIESGILTDEEIAACCDIYSKFKVGYVKTSTGFAEQGATVHAVELMRDRLPKHIGIKASGGIRTWAFAKELIDAGATRLGCSASMAIMKEWRMRADR